MKQHPIINTLNVLGAAAENECYYLNAGGCAVYANLVAKELDKLGIPVHGIVATYEPKDLNKVRQGVTNANKKREWNANGLDFSHVGVEFKLGNRWYQYDSKGVHPRKSWLNREWWKVCKGHLSLVELDGIANEAAGWNDDFNRRTEIPKLKRLTKQFFKEVVK